MLLSITGKTTYKNKKYKLPPSPPRLPFIGNLHQVSSLTLQSLRALSLKYGTLMLLQFGQVPTLIVSSADMAQEIMKKQGDIFASRPSMKADNILGYGAKNVSFAPYGDYWKNAKKLYIDHLLGTGIYSSFILIYCSMFHYLNRQQQTNYSHSQRFPFYSYFLLVKGLLVNNLRTRKSAIFEASERGTSLLGAREDSIRSKNV